MSRHSFEGAIKGYLVNQMGKNLWRVASSMTDDDFMQEGFEVYLKCANRYPDVDPPHFMALYKTALRNRITDLSNEDTDSRTVPMHRVVDDETVMLEPMGETDNEGYLRVVIRQAPAEVVQVLTLFLSAPTELLEMAMSSWRRSGHIRAGGNKQVAQWLGLPDNSRPLDQVRDYFESAL